MITIFIYSISVFSILILYYFYKPKQQHHHQNQKDETLNDLDHSDLLSLSSSNISDSIVTTASLNDQQSNYEYELLNENNQNVKYYYPYTYTNYKESKGEFITKNNKKRYLIDNSEAIIVEFFNKYFNKSLISKYLGISSNDNNKNSSNNKDNSYLRSIIHETFKSV
jgi:hypothetical protein